MRCPWAAQVSTYGGSATDGVRNTAYCAGGAANVSLLLREFGALEAAHPLRAWTFGLCHEEHEEWRACRASPMFHKDATHNYACVPYAGPRL